ncbi:hypothetical protein ACHAW5_004305 [Stephanodiscus triporus]|uniref:Uncharacterized protein n=1 Tax=Stephanodiscus triporus TaxID=2934178 RepID=A0ABD3PZD0_9STRA
MVKRRTRAAASTAERDGASSVPDDDGVEGGGVVPVVLDDDAPPAASSGDDVWDDLRRALSEGLLPLIGPSSGYGSLARLALSDFDDEDDDDERRKTRRRLTDASLELFRFIERLASMEERLKGALERRRRRTADGGGFGAGDGATDEQEEDDEGGEDCGLSGLPSLYVGDDDYDDGAGGSTTADAETMWGQVDLQNAALLPLLRKRIKKLVGCCEGGPAGMGRRENDEDRTVRILRTGGGSDADDDENGEEDDDGDSGEDEDDGDGEGREAGVSGDLNDEDSEGGDDEGRRIRERMERTMADTCRDEDDDEDEDEDEDEDDNQRIDVTLKKSSSRQYEGVPDDVEGDNFIGVDPTREEMLDGFFDLHEMEAFADEEEEMLPDDAFGEEDDRGDEDDGGKKKKEEKEKEKKGMLPHLRDRLGDVSEGDDDGGDYDDDNSDDDANDDEEDPLAKRFRPTTVRRRKYRADDENDDGGFKDDDEAGVVDASTMTAADFFGKPSKKLMRKYKAKLDVKVKKGGKKGMGDNKKKTEVKSFAGDNDDDSWDNHNFEEDGMDWKGNDGDGEEEDDDDDKEVGASEWDQNGNDDDYEEAMNNNIEEDGIVENKQKLSAHEIRLQKLQQQTLRLEQDMMAEKPWKMMGEAKGTNRAVDSLLDSTPEFEVAFKPPPILTPQHAANIEEMIKKRIVDEDWDDVVPRELPDIGGRKRGGEAPEVSQEKSKLGLGELYEREYLKKTAGFDRDAHEKQTEEDAAKEEMKRLFANLCSQLDALSNYHFAPRPVADEADVQNRDDVPAIAMEEVLPLHVSRSRGIAPEEVHAAGRGRKSVLKGESELDQSARRKARQQKHADEKLVSKLQPGLGLNNPYEKRKLREELQMARASGKIVVAADNKGRWKDEAAAGKEYQTSTKFFAKMQENVEGLIHGTAGEGDGRAKKKRKGLEAGQASSLYRL